MTPVYLAVLIRKIDEIFGNFGNIHNYIKWFLRRKSGYLTRDANFTQRKFYFNKRVMLAGGNI